MTVEQLDNTLRAVLVQYERAMHELGWTMVDVRARDTLDALVALTRDLERRLEVAEIMDMSATATQWEGAFKNERRRAEAAEERYEKLLSEVGGVWPG